MTDEVVLCVGPAVEHVRTSWASDIDRALSLRKGIFDKVFRVPRDSWLQLAKDAKAILRANSSVPDLALLPLLIAGDAEIGMARTWLSEHPEVTLSVASAHEVFDITGPIIELHQRLGITTDPAVRALMFASNIPAAGVPIAVWVVPRMLAFR